MKFIKLLGCACLLTILWFRPWIARGPRAFVEQSTRRVSVPPGTVKIRTSFTIRNIGGSMLRLKETSTSCGCTVLSLSQTEIAPDDQAVISVEGIPPLAGSRRVAMTIYTNEIENPEIPLTLIMDGINEVPRIDHASEVVNFGEVSDVGKTVQIQIVALERSEAKPWLDRASCSLKELSVEGGLAEESNTGNGVVHRRYIYTCTIKSLSRPGVLRGEVAFFNEDPAASRVATVTVLASVQAPSMD